jgi:hypothetical protein
MCDTVAAEGGFYLTFKNSCNQNVPLNAAEVFFYHAAAGHMRIISKKNDSYFVELVNEDNIGTILAEDDCILVDVQATTESNLNPAARCVTGLFNAPALNGTATIFIHNGSGIPIGSTLTFTANGQTGSYQVASYVSASGNTFTYTVTNVGGGHTPGTIIDGDAGGACSIPIEIITEVDLCDLSETNTATSITACLDGSPRALVPTGLNDVITGTADGSWTMQKLTGLDCCVTIDGCLKFSGATCPSGTDQVVLRNVNIDCFTDAFNEAMELGEGLAMNIDGFPVIVSAYNSGSRTITISPAEDSTLDTLLEFPEGTQICIGSCCSACKNGIQTTNFVRLEGDVGPETANVFAFNGESISHDAGVSYWLVGVDTLGAQAVLELDATYFSNPSGSGYASFPNFSDPLMLRQKMCNTHPSGCRQGAKMFLNYQIGFDSLDADVTIDWEIAVLSYPSATLSDGFAPNPFYGNNPGSNQEAAGRITGAGAADATLLNTPFGSGLATAIKPFPYSAGTIVSPIKLYKCDCVTTMVYCFLRVTATNPGSFLPYVGIQRYIEKHTFVSLATPDNELDSGGWN